MPPVVQIASTPPRGSAIEALEHLLRTHPIASGPFALCLIEVDGFERIAPTFHEAVRAELLHLVRARVEGLLPVDATLLAPGAGERLAVLVADVRGGLAAVELARDIVRHVGEAFVACDEELYVTVSVGVAHSGDDGFDRETDNPAALVRKAERALTEAKRRGGNNVQLFRPDLETPRRGGLESDLAHALERRELALFYQAQLEPATGRIVGVEALLRWHHPERGSIPLSELLPIAERTGLLIPIGAWVLGRACIQAASWHRRGLDEIRVAVNLAACELASPGLPEALLAALAHAHLEPRFLELEIADAVARDHEATLEQLAALGVSLAIQDVGVDASPAALMAQPIHSMKLGQSLVRGIVDDPARAAHVRELVAAARTRGLRVVAEGVETEAELALLRELGCDHVQGFLVSRPVPADQVETLLFPTPAGRDTASG